MNWITTGWRNENYNLQNVDYEFNNHSHYKHVKWIQDFKIAQRKISCAKKHSEALPPKQILIFDEKYCQKKYRLKKLTFSHKVLKKYWVHTAKRQGRFKWTRQDSKCEPCRTKKIQKMYKLKKGQREIMYTVKHATW